MVKSTCPDHFESLSTKQNPNKLQDVSNIKYAPSMLRKRKNSQNFPLAHFEKHTKQNISEANS